MLRLKDFTELEKLAEAWADSRKAVGVAIEQHCSDEYWQDMVEKSSQAHMDFINKLYAMRMELINEL